MSPQLYWFLFTVLIILLVLVSIYLIYNIVSDLCCDEDMPDTGINHKRIMPHNYFDTDVEDLTKMERKPSRGSFRVSFVDEVDNTKLNSWLKEQKHIKSIDEGAVEEEQPKLITFTSELKKTDEEFEPSEPQAAIARIEQQAKNLEADMMSTYGQLSELRYYETNEQFILLQIELCDVYCETNELRDKKKVVAKFIEQCQVKLKEGTMNKMK